MPSCHSHNIARAVTLAIFVISGTGFAVAADRCEYEPASPQAREECLAEFCNADETGQENSESERARCIAGVYDNWETIKHCKPVLLLPVTSPAQEKSCQALAYLSRSVGEALEKLARLELYLQVASEIGGSRSPFVEPPPPPPGPKPYLVSLLGSLSEKQRIVVHERMKEIVEIQQKGRLTEIDRVFSAAGTK